MLPVNHPWSSSTRPAHTLDSKQSAVSQRQEQYQELYHQPLPVRTLHLFCKLAHLLKVSIGPFELIKNVTQTSVLMAADAVPRGTPIKGASPKNQGRISTWGACKKIYQRGGLLGFYTGFQLHLVRDVVGSGIYFGVYEATKQVMTTYSGAEKANTFAAVGPAGIICGCFSWIVVSVLQLCRPESEFLLTTKRQTYPLDTMKTRAQNLLVGEIGKTARECAANAAKTSKWKGIEMMILRSSIQNMIQMSLFEYAKQEINSSRFDNGTTEWKKTTAKEKKKSGIAVGKGGSDL